MAEAYKIWKQIFCLVAGLCCFLVMDSWGDAPKGESVEIVNSETNAPEGGYMSWLSIYEQIINSKSNTDSSSPSSAVRPEPTPVTIQQRPSSGSESHSPIAN